MSDTKIIALTPEQVWERYVAADKRVRELEKFVTAIRLADQLIADGYEENGKIQLRESIAHLDSEK